jgi:hypothetical protein
MIESRGQEILVGFLTLFSFSLYSEKIVTQSTDMPDDYYGLEIGGVLSPSFGYRYRDSGSGISNTEPNDRTGFSLPWTLLTVEKKWTDSGIKAELWFELLRSNTFSNDTVGTVSPTGEPRKPDPYTLGIRRGNIQKSFEVGDWSHKFIFGIQEMPSTYTQWSGAWDWRYIDRSPMESLGLFSAPADLGFSYLIKNTVWSAQVGVANGEGYRSLQNAESSGVDAFGRLSWEPGYENWKFGLHLIGRAGNLLGIAGNECREGRTGCLPSDGNLGTDLEKDLRAQRSETLGFELTIQESSFFHFGSGYVWRRQYSGALRDRLNPTPMIYEKDRFGSGLYIWMGLGWDKFWIVLRGERATGESGVLSATYSRRDELTSRLESIYSARTVDIYSDRSYFYRRSVILEYRWLENFRLSIAGAQVNNFDSNGEREKVYLDQRGESRERSDYLNQWESGQSEGILEFRKVHRQIYLTASFSF